VTITRVDKLSFAVLEQFARKVDDSGAVSGALVGAVSGAVGGAVSGVVGDAVGDALGGGERRKRRGSAQFGLTGTSSGHSP
jgi:uncharacterized membrane protein